MRPNIIKVGFLRGGLEIKQFMRQRESVVFTLLFPVMLLFIFGSVFKGDLAPGVTFSQYFVAGMIASGLVNTGFQQLAIMIPIERDFGTLKRLRGTPVSPISYFIGKAILVFTAMIVQVGALMAFGAALFGLNLPNTTERWLRFAWLILLGSICSTILGIAFSAVPKNGRGASAVSCAKPPRKTCWPQASISTCGWSGAARTVAASYSRNCSTWWPTVRCYSACWTTMPCGRNRRCCACATSWWRAREQRKTPST